jgi:hypothetical protein
MTYQAAGWSAAGLGQGQRAVHLIRWTPLPHRRYRPAPATGPAELADVR